MKRLFIAYKIIPDQGFLSGFRKLKRAMQIQQVKWVEENNIHITLKFLGETEENRLALIDNILRLRASRQSAITIRLNGLGVFGSRHDPRVIWTGIEPYEALAMLMKEMRDDFIPAGYPADRQNIVPHLTLGRVKQIGDKTQFQQSLDQYRNLTSEPIKLEKIILFESILRREGPLYTVLKEYPAVHPLP
jgi:2'-5' RNA ligase